MRTPLIVAGLIATALAGGCGSDDKGGGAATGAPSASSAPTATAVPARLLGSYTRRVTKGDIARTAGRRGEAGRNEGAPPPGPARLVITDGSFRLSSQDPVAADAPPLTVIQNVTASDGGAVSILGYAHPERGAFCGPEVPQTAAYTWRASGASLTLKAARDACADRDSLLAGTWTRQS